MSTTENVLRVPELAPEDCFFCRPRQREIVTSNALAMVLTDSYPVVDDHCLIIPRRHAPTVFDLTGDEMQAIFEVLEQARQMLMDKDSAISGFNFGVNAGRSAGQSVFHCHFHLFPRRDGDQENPRGGVRRIFPEKALYTRRRKSPG